jgi:glycosyltransferase involved in cell wall biosynthesis
MTPAFPDTPDILLVSTADWDNPYWTNKQHVAVELAGRGHRVFFVESPGLRRPRATARDLGRLWRRLKRGLGRPRRVRERMWVFSPLLFPFQSCRLIRRLNRRILQTSLWFRLRQVGVTPVILWTYSPLTLELLKAGDYELMVYHAVDDIKSQPGMPRAVIAAAEEILSRTADIIFTTSAALQEAHGALNPRTYYFPNVADFEHFYRALDEATELPADLAAIPAPRIGFIGAISGYKLDFILLRALAEARPAWSLVMIGEVGEGDAWTDVAALRQVPSVHFLGGRPYGSLPAYLKGFDVAILPNRINEYTKSMFPMKFFEYLAAGRQIVGINLPSLAAYARLATFADNDHDFIAAIDMVLAGTGIPLSERLAAAKEQTYQSRTARMMALVMRRLAEKRG